MRRETFPAPGPLRVTVRITSGSVAVETADTAEASVSVEPLNSAAERVLGDVTIALDEDRLVVDYGSGVRFGLIMRSPSFRVSVRVPDESSLDVATVSADVRAGGRLGQLEAKTVSGTVAVGDVSGDATIKTVSGEVELGKVDGRVSVNTVSGEVKVTEAARGATTRTVSGSQAIDSVTEGQVQLQSVSGDIRIGIRQGSGVWFDLRSASGKTTSELEPVDGPAADGPTVELRAKAVSGDIRIVRAA